jgi:hypothetical protein
VLAPRNPGTSGKKATRVLYLEHLETTDLENLAEHWGLESPENRKEAVEALKAYVKEWLGTQWLEERVEGCTMPARAWPASVVLDNRVSDNNNNSKHVYARHHMLRSTRIV